MSEGFRKDQSLSMEGVCLSLKPCNHSEQIKIFYLHLSDDQKQDHSVVASHITSMLSDLFARGDIKKEELKKY